MTTTWLYIVILWADFAQPRPVPYPTPKACEQAKANIIASQDRFRTGQFMTGLVIHCSPERP